MNLPIVLDNILKKNNATTQQKFWETLRSNPSATDDKGYVYGFTLETDGNTETQLWIKLGRTQRDPHARISEWKGNMNFCVKTNFNKRLERLIHLLFSSAHKYRLEPDRCNEKEWFYFDEDIDVPALVCTLKTFFEKYMSSKMTSHSTTPITIPATNSISKPLSPVSSISKVNINTDTAQDLLINLAHCKTGRERALGPTLAPRVVEYREKHGRYLRIEDILNVPMIGRATFDALKNDICV